MSDIKAKAQGLEPSVGPRDVGAMVKDTGNVYESLSIISKRSRQLNTELKYELHQKLEEFAVSSDTIEEINENKEQIEISKFYEKLPNPALIATEEFTKGELAYRLVDKKPRLNRGGGE
ncbi:MAG: DNA-directed RNA polymerase subunit omega [Saprospiraceae bacterium]|nr:DNA-directed RNA polymerase subunit omega [Saprospiraceae bacterium]HRD79542.1 DNA-directed RNA polymerase subunit omega [Saprospiraceae bacterium]HRF37933.1 DNA-directed RNA polymerase subunit omega [Saprospiraceae bacterium]HRK82828.1 DNA-directed RNA polymerase subunit omega [Saprospiraceae bacterium]